MEVITTIKKILRETEVRILEHTGVSINLYYENKLANNYLPYSIPLEKIKKLIESELDIVDDMLKKSRSSDYVRARDYYMYWLRTHTQLSSTQIGNKVNKDHATVLYCVRKLKDEFELYPNLKLHYTIIEIKIKQLIDITALENVQVAIASNN
jgi:chromosomal replication initiation ATPase DnaA